jgi:hypothetical protein
MNLRLAIKRHEDLANAFARTGKAKLARMHLLRAEQLRTAKTIRKEMRHEPANAA